MGCGASATPQAQGPRPSAQAAGAAEGAGGATADEARSKKLLEEYTVGPTLGEGAFGLVASCKQTKTGEEFAVKFIDKVETPVAAIYKEAEMLANLDHPNVVKFHGVFFERCFVCIVMSIYQGGDLVEGLQRHLKSKGLINPFAAVPAETQICASVEYLMSNSVVHRDIKGDNYLMDRPDITDPECAIVLTDFGTATSLKPGERLDSAVGTKIFWSPEFYDRCYGLKVDVWAMGVITYGLLSGRFPFRDEKDVKNKEVRLPKRTHPVCEEFIRHMLSKDEGARLTARQARWHPWLSEFGPKGLGGLNSSESEDGEANSELREQKVTEDVQERRKELMSRLAAEHDVRKGSAGARKQVVSDHYLNAHFTLPDRVTEGATFIYEWWGEEKARAAKLFDQQARGTPLTEEGRDLHLFRKMLQDHNIDTEVFGVGKAKKLEQLNDEVHSGACRLMLDATKHKTIVRVVDVVLFRLRSADGPSGRLLIETEERFADGRTRDTGRLPGTKKEPHENSRQTAERILQELSLSVKQVSMDLSNVLRFEEETDSPSYPGVRTVYRKEIVEAVLKVVDTSAMMSMGLPSYSAWSASGTKGAKTFNWWTEETARAKGLKFRATSAEAVSALVRAPIGLNEEQLQEELAGNGIDLSLYGQKDKTVTLKQFSAELCRGESTLVKDPEKGLLRVVDLIMLVVMNRDAGSVLTQVAHQSPNGTRTVLKRLPGAKCRPDENHFLSARRILRRALEIGENSATLGRDVVVVDDERSNDAYPGLTTMYRKRVITAEVAGELRE